MEDDLLLLSVSLLEPFILSEPSSAVGGTSTKLIDLEADLDPDKKAAALFVEFAVTLALGAVGATKEVCPQLLLTQEGPPTDVSSNTSYLYPW